MKYCPITYDCLAGQEDYSQSGLRMLSPQLRCLKPLLMDAQEQRDEAIAIVGKMSIQGVQPKLSACLKIKEGCFEIVDQNGKYILKPPSAIYAELPENEAVTMSLAKTIGLEVPVHGLVYAKDNTMTYFIKRFDRLGYSKKFAVEDFGQLSGAKRAIKYESSMEKVISIISDFCTFPKIECVKLFKLILFNFLVGNEDMHLKNFSLIARDKIVSLSPVYDLVNTTIVLKHVKEEMALPLNGKKNNLRKSDFLSYLAVERLSLNQPTITHVLEEIQKMMPVWHELISRSFLSQPMQVKYRDLIEERAHRLGIV